MSKFEEKREALGLILFFLSLALILMFYLPVTITGVLGSFIRIFGFGLLGSAANLIPILTLYASIDFFLEKRKGVSQIRVRSVVLLLVCVSAFLATVTMDFDYFQTLTVNEKGKESAFKALGLLWNSGADSSLIAGYDTTVLPGGIIGGSVAVGLNLVLGRVIAAMSIVAFFLTQLMLVFHVSIKKTAKHAATAIKTTVKQRSTGAGGVNVYSPQSGATVYTNMQSPSAANLAPRHVSVPQNKPALNTGYDPFKAKLPVDRESGFIDVSDAAFGVSPTHVTGSLNYEDKTVDITGDHPSADFTYTAMPKNAPLHRTGTMNVPSFLKQEEQEDFFDLTPVDTPVAFEDDIPEDDDLPYEIEGTSDAGDDYVYTPKNMGPVRTPSFGTTQTVTVEKIEEQSPAVQEIPVNVQTKEVGFSATEGRIIEGADQERTQVKKPAAQPRRRKIAYKTVPASLLPADSKSKQNTDSQLVLRDKAERLEMALKSFGVDAKVINITHGPAITRFELTIATGTKVSKVLSLQDDIQLAMAAQSVRIEAPIPGKSAIGVEIPNDKTSVVNLRDLIDTSEYKKSTPLTVALGRDIPGRPIYCDLAKMPHLLIAGATGSGKSVCINSILVSILCHSTPNQVRMILIDPKVVELSVYNGIPHLYMPVVTKPKEAAATLAWAVNEMNDRYRKFADTGVRDISGYNEYLKMNGDTPLPLVLIVIDELADLMTVAAKEVENNISRLAAMARAAGLHLIIATQRPSVDVITGVIKANVPSRIAFAVSSGVDSRTILDSVGAEKLLGKGDMLYAPQSAPKPVRGQGAFLTDKEVETCVNYLKTNFGPNYNDEIRAAIANAGSSESSGAGAADGGDSEDDDLLDKAAETVIEYGSASVSILQRRLGVGYPRAARLIDVLERKHIIGPFEGSKPRKVLITAAEWAEIKAKGGS